MADLVEKRASRQEVKDFAKTMESDHKAMLKDLAKVIKNKKIAIVAGTNKVDKERCAKMSKLSGKEFEGSFFLNVVSDHEDAIAMYENQIENGKDEKVTAFAKEAVKKLREHLKEAKKLRS